MLIDTQSQKVLFSLLDTNSQYVSGENGDDLVLLQREYAMHFQPATPRERYLVDVLIRAEWTLSRLFRAEAQLWICNYERDDLSNGIALGVAWDKASPKFMRLQRRVTLAERAYNEAVAELDRLRALRPAAAKSLPATPPADSPSTVAPRPEPATTSTPPEAPTPVKPAARHRRPKSPVNQPAARGPIPIAAPAVTMLILLSSLLAAGQPPTPANAPDRATAPPALPRVGTMVFTPENGSEADCQSSQNRFLHESEPAGG